MRVHLLIAIASACALGACAGYFEPVRAFEPILSDEIAYRGRTFEGWVTFVPDGAGLGAQMTRNGPIAGIATDSEVRLERAGIRVGDRRYVRATVEPSGICINECRALRGEGFYLKGVRLLRREEVIAVPAQ